MSGTQVLDLGCGGGGFSVALAEGGANCLGVDLKEERIDEGRKLAADRGVAVGFLAADVLEMDGFEKSFDLIVLSEVMEHLANYSNVEALLCWCRRHLIPPGKIYVSFPPWFSPFAGHQSGWPGIRRLPWYHLFPDKLKRLLIPNHAPRYIEFARELNRLTIGVFKRAVDGAHLTIAREELYHLRPEYHFRYGTPILQASSLMARIPLAREITTTGAYFLLAR